MREALDALIQLAAYRHSTPGDQKSALDEIFTPTRRETKSLAEDGDSNPRSLLV
jgi:hypothetical protein